MNAECIHDIGTVNRDRIGTEVESGGDFFVRLAIDDHLQNFELALCQGGAALATQSRLLLDFGVKDSLSGCDLADSCTEFKIEGVFQDIALGAGFNRLTDPSALAMHTKHENSRIWRAFDNLASRVEAVHARQGAVHHDNLRVELLCQPDRLFTVASFADDFHVGFIFQHAAEATPYQTVVIHEQHCDLLLHKTPLSLEAR